MASEREAATIDHLIAAAKVDAGKLLGIINTEIYRQDGAATNMLAVVNSQEMIRAAIDNGRTLMGHADRKMVLQISGVAPVPRNQVTNVTIRDNKIDASKNLTVNGPRSLEEVVRDVDATVQAIPALIEGGN